MEEKTKIFIFPSDEIQEVLSAHRVDLVEKLVRLLQDEVKEVSQEIEQDPAGAGSGLKASPKVILASGLASTSIILALTPAVTKIMAAISHKDIILQEVTLVSVKDQSGKPIQKWVKHPHPLGSPGELQQKTEFSVKGPFGFQLTFSESSQESEKESLPKNGSPKK